MKKPLNLHTSDEETEGTPVKNGAMNFNTDVRRGFDGWKKGGYNNVKHSAIYKQAVQETGLQRECCEEGEERVWLAVWKNDQFNHLNQS